MDLGPFSGLQWGAGALRQEEAPWHPTIYGWVQSQKPLENIGLAGCSGRAHGKFEGCRLHRLQ